MSGMIFNRPRAAKKNRLTWYINETPVPTAGMHYTVNFTSNGKSFVGISGVSGSTKSLSYATSATKQTRVWRKSSTLSTWTDEAYRTITFEEEPTGDLLTWLEANATPQ